MSLETENRGPLRVNKKRNQKGDMEDGRIIPTKSNNTGGHGGKRPGTGRKKKAMTEKALNGNPEGRILTVLDIPDAEGAAMPKSKEILSMKQRDSTELRAKELYNGRNTRRSKLRCNQNRSVAATYRKRSRLLRLCPCKRGHNAFAALPTFFGLYAFGVNIFFGVFSHVVVMNTLFFNFCVLEFAGLL